MSTDHERRCTATKRNGQRCRAFACTGDHRCSAHGGTPTGKRRRPICTCPAYAWPHRPRGGFCRYPLEPEYRLTTPAGSHNNERRRANRVRQKLGYKPLSVQGLV